MTSRHEYDRTGRRPGPGAASRAFRRSAVALCTAAASTAVFAFPSGVAQAAPAALTVAEAKAQIDQLQMEAAAIDQEYVGVKEQIDQGKAQLAAKRADVAEQAALVAKAKLQVGQVALARFQNRNVDTAAQIFFTSESDDNFLSQISTVEKVSQNQNNVLQDYQEQQAELAELEHSTKTDLAVLTEQEQQLGTLRAESERKVDESEKVLARLTAAEQAALAAAEKRAADEARKLAERAARNAESSADTSDAPADSDSDSDSDRTDDDSDSASSGNRGTAALAYARKQLGKPYRFAAAGPAAFDCSGLTSKAWQAAGVTLPRTAATQWRVGKAVSKSELQPGDLVFFYSSTAPSHVALYVGDGVILHAPRTGKSVEYSKMSYMPYVGARRPG